MNEGASLQSGYITSVEELREFYGEPSGMVLEKQIDRLDEGCRRYLAASPFFLLATSTKAGGDCSPRGDGPGSVEVADEKTLLIPDRAGNNRIDSLTNIVENPQVGLLFMVPGITYTLRVNGAARLSVDPELLERFTFRRKAPRSVIVVSVEEVFVQCARAILRAGLWNPERHVDPQEVPSMGEMLAAHTGGSVEAESYDDRDRNDNADGLY